MPWRVPLRTRAVCARGTSTRAHARCCLSSAPCACCISPKPLVVRAALLKRAATPHLLKHGFAGIQEAAVGNDGILNVRLNAAHMQEQQRRCIS